MTWHQHYQRSHERWFAITYPSAYKDGHYPGPRYPKVNTANGKNTCIRQFLEWEGYMTDRTNSMGIPTKRMIPKFNLLAGKVIEYEGAPIWRKQNSKKGRPDVMAIMEGGRYNGFETKTPNDRLSDDQKDFHAMIRKAGGFVLVVGPIEDFFSWYENRKVSLK